MTQSVMSDAILKPHPEVISRRLGDAAVLVHLTSNRIFELNATGARIWELICEGLDEPAISAKLAEEFDVEPTLAAEELRGLLARLRHEGLVQ